MESATKHELEWPEARHCPYEFYDRLRADDPVHLARGDEGYLITRYEDLVWAARHPECFSNRRLRFDEADPEAGAIAAEGYPSPPTVVDNDPPEHTKYREVGFQAFTPKRLAAYEPAVRQICDELIDAFVARGSVEFVGEFARKVPMRVVCELLSFPRDLAEQLTEWADARTELLKLPQWHVPRERALELQRLGVELEQFLAGQIEDRRVNPGDDVLTEIVHAEVDASIECGLPHLVAMVKMILTAGTESTSYLIANAMWLLLRKRGEYERVAANRALIPQLLEETLRHESPVQWSQRNCIVDTEVAGTRIPAGSRVLLMWGAGNRDPSLFEAPAEFDLDRENARRHLGFGIGPHTCVGAPLARLEGRIAFEQVLSRMKNLRLDDPVSEPPRVDVTVLRGISELRLGFDPAR